jgi:aromatic ring hydroxylase
MAYRDMIAGNGRFLTFCGGPPVIGQRMQSDPADRVSVKRVSENDKGMVLRGRLGMHTSPAYAEDIWVGTLTGLTIDGHPVGFIVPVNAPGVTILCRKVATRDRDPCRSPLSARYDELDGQIWLDNVFIPWERVFAVDPEPEAIPRWLRWHHLRGWLAKAEFTLGLALALTDAMGLKQNEATVGYLVDLIAEVQIVRSCIIAAEHDPQFTPTGYCVPNHAHLAAGGIALFKAPTAHVRAIAHHPRILVGDGTNRQRPRHARTGRGPRGNVWWRRILCATASSAFATRVGSRLFVA